jgi:hypothetical protein
VRLRAITGRLQALGERCGIRNIRVSGMNASTSDITNAESTGGSATACSSLMNAFQ